jgi:hypothetical protein
MYNRSAGYNNSEMGEDRVLGMITIERTAAYPMDHCFTIANHSNLIYVYNKRIITLEVLTLA